ncbi:hypothetical protein [Stenotrophomonas lactitubi]
MNAQTSKEGATPDAPRDAATASFDPTCTSANSALKVGAEQKRAASSLASQFQGTSLMKVGYGDTFGMDLAGSRSSVEVIQVNREDGRRTELRSVQYNGNLPASRISAYGADGQGDTAQRCYAFTFDLCGHAQGEQVRSGICCEYAPLHGRRPGD